MWIAFYSSRGYTTTLDLQPEQFASKPVKDLLAQGLKPVVARNGQTALLFPNEDGTYHAEGFDLGNHPLVDFYFPGYCVTHAENVALCPRPAAVAPAPPAGGQPAPAPPPSTGGPTGGSTTAPPPPVLPPQMPPINPHLAPVITGEPITTAILTGLGALFSILGLFGGGDWKEPFRKLALALGDIQNILMNFIWFIAHSLRWVLNALRQLWERVLRPLIQHINDITSRIVQIINKVLKPYLDLIARIRKQILEIYARWFVPVIRAIQQVRVMLSLLRLLHVPGVKALDEKLARIEGKLIGVIQTLLSRVNDHSGLLNILLTARLTLQRGILLPSLAESRGSWINSWWNTQRVDRSAADIQAGADLDAHINSRPGVRVMGDLLKTGVYVSTWAPGPGEQELQVLLKGGAA